MILNLESSKIGTPLLALLELDVYLKLSILCEEFYIFYLLWIIGHYLMSLNLSKSFFLKIFLSFTQ